MTASGNLVALIHRAIGGDAKVVIQHERGRVVAAVERGHLLLGDVLDRRRAGACHFALGAWPSGPERAEPAVLADDCST
jgi:hypothetical protein